MAKPAICQRPEKIQRISHEKTKVMIVGQDQHHPPLTLGEYDIEYVENFPYLGSNISSTGDVEKDIRTRISKAAGVFQRLRNVWLSKAITTTIKLHLYVSGHSNSDLRLRDVDEGCQHYQHVGCLPPTTPQNRVEDLMARPHRQR
ncbi:hypothetical protein ABVT39_002491 [Epinephelus coioides]